MNLTGSRNDAWVAFPKPAPRASLRLFCFPFSGAAGSVFYPWAEALPGAIEVCPVLLPGRGPRIFEPSFTSLAALIEALAGGLAAYLDKPFAFFGHSMGALVAFELARRLRAGHSPLPVYLFVSAHSAPQAPDREEPIHGLPEVEFQEKIRTLNGTPEEIFANPELRDLVMPVLRADFTVCETYQYQAQEPLPVPMCALGGLQDLSVRREDLQAWQEHTTGPFSVRLFPGDHFFINSARSFVLQVVARELSRFLG